MLFISLIGLKNRKLILPEGDITYVYCTCTSGNSVHTTYVRMYMYTYSMYLRVLCTYNIYTYVHMYACISGYFVHTTCVCTCSRICMYLRVLCSYNNMYTYVHVCMYVRTSGLDESAIWGRSPVPLWTGTRWDCRDRWS